MQKKKKFDIISFYKFVILDNLEKHQLTIKKFLIDNHLKGTLILSPEGLNGTVSGSEGFTSQFNQFIFRNFSFDSYDSTNISTSFKIPFDRPKVKIKKELVPIEKNILERGGRHISPKDWNEFVKNEDVVLIDIRKPFEYEIGSFEGSINPNVNNFREFKGYFDDLIKKNTKKLAIFCTGGIRCEKASEYLKEKGVEEVYQLKGGILNYINTVEKEKSLWNGECYVFDKRVSVKHRSIQGSYSMCYGCRMPINDRDKKSEHYKQGVSCPHCFDKVTPDQKKRFAMREFNKNKEIK
jgi:UPF0176 protein